MAHDSTSNSLAKMIAAGTAERTAGLAIEDRQQVTETTVCLWCLTTELADPPQRRPGA